MKLEALMDRFSIIDINGGLFDVLTITNITKVYLMRLE